jgi:endonuclease III
VSKKSETAARLQKKIKPRWKLPKAREERGLLESGVVALLMRHMSEAKAESSLKALLAAYDDWNEARVSQVQEIAGHLRHEAGRGIGLLAKREPAARDLKRWLQEVFQQTHSLTLNELGEDHQSTSRLMGNLSFTGLATSSWLLGLAHPGEMPVHSGLVRVFDRLGLMTRTSSPNKAREALGPLVPGGHTMAFVHAFSEIADLYCESRRPLCQDCPLVDDCKMGKKVYKEWKVQQARLAERRKKEEERAAKQAAIDERRRLRDEERARKRAEVEARKRERAAEQMRKKARAASQKKAAQKKATQEKAAAKKAAQKKAARKKAAQKKVSKKAPAKKAARKSSAKKAAVKKAVKKVAKKAAAKKAVKKAAKKAAAKKAVKKAAKKAPAKKAAKKVAKKKTSKQKA